MNWFLGILCTLLSTGLLAWIAYNLFIETLPAAEGRSPIPALIFSALLLYVGITRLRKALRTK